MGIRAFAVFFAACTTILAQTDAQEIVRRSVEHADRSWQARLNYLYTKRTEGKRLDALTWTSRTIWSSTEGQSR